MTGAPLLSEIAFRGEIGEAGRAGEEALRLLCGLPVPVGLPEGYDSGAPLWAWHGPLLIGYGRLVRGPGVMSWIDEIAVLPEYRDEGIERDILCRLVHAHRMPYGEGRILYGPARAPVRIADVLAILRAASRGAGGSTG